MTTLSQNEKTMHRAGIVGRTGEGLGKGALTGTAVGLGALRAGASPRAVKALMAVGALGGAAAGTAKGIRESAQDTANEQRKDYRYHRARADRTEDFQARRRMLKSAAMESFADELSKSAMLGAAMKTVGSKLIGMGSRAAGAIGQGQRYGTAMKSLAGSRFGGKALAQNVGMAATGTGLVGAGMLAGRATAPSPQGY